jgi:hypothetical protein
MAISTLPAADALNDDVPPNCVSSTPETLPVLIGKRRRALMVGDAW